MIDIEEYNYDLPENRIALYPVNPRHNSKLLVYQNGQILHRHFFNLSDYLPENCTLVFNETKVINARLKFKNKNGADIELFLLHPKNENDKIDLHLKISGRDEWVCMIGRKKKWPHDEVLHLKGNDIELSARQIDNESIEFRWIPAEKHFSEILEALGETPLPPYMKRKAEEADKSSYQTIYSKNEGSVAAPTAGLHFTDDVFDSLQGKNINIQKVTLHVGAGTFAPVKEKNALQHTMHQEQFIITRENVNKILENQSTTIAVGTTSMRWLESAYWYGVILGEDLNAKCLISQTTPQEFTPIDKYQSMKNILQKMDEENTDEIIGQTSIYIYPGYEFQICGGIITNFHQPKSTLMLLISAIVGADWKKIYTEALQNDYRFLSYGDSSLLFLH